MLEVSTAMLKRELRAAGRHPSELPSAENSVSARSVHRAGPKVYADLLARASEVLARALSSMPPKAQKGLLEAPAGEEVLVRAALHPTVVEHVVSSSPLLPALLRGVEERRHLLNIEGGTLSAGEVAQVLGITRQAVDKQRRGHKLLGLRVGQTWRYPVWQFVDGAPLAGLDRVLTRLRDVSPWTVAAFIVGRHARLGGRRPLDLLRKGEVTLVVDAARAYGTHGAA